jgi:uncharacterized membrane protein YdbT with pleckstrin-like domain
MPYPRKLLNADETIAVDLHPHWWYFAEAAAALIGSIILAIIALSVLDSGGFKSFVLWVLIAAIVLSAIWLVIRYLKWATTNFVITSDRVVFRHGVIAKSGIEIPLDRVNNVNFNQGIFERMIGAGDLLIESGGEDGQQRFTDVRRPERVQQVIHAQINDMTRRRSGGSGFAPPASSGADVAQQLERLEGLRDRGSITPEEFENQKRRLLG